MSNEDQKGAGAERPRRRAPVPLAQDVTSLLQQHLKSRGFAQVELVTRWAEIAGSSLAAHCYPSRLSAAPSGGATLTLVADDRAALELQHQSTKVIDRINTYLGRQAVTRLKVVTGEIPKPVRMQPPPRRLTADEEHALTGRTSAVANPELRAALTRLGRLALAESRKTAVLKR